MWSIFEKFRERLSEKVPVTILIGIVGWFELTVLYRNWKEWHERPWNYVCKYLRKAANVGLTVTVSGTVYWSYPILPFGIVVCTLFPTTFLEITANARLSWPYWKGDCSTLDRFTAKVTATITSESDSFRLTEEQFCTCVTLLVYISLLSLHDQDVELPNFTFYGERVHKATIFSFFFLNQMIGQFIQRI